VEKHPKDTLGDRARGLRVFAHKPHYRDQSEKHKDHETFHCHLLKTEGTKHETFVSPCGLDPS
jgi:hypothetical protein